MALKSYLRTPGETDRLLEVWLARIEPFYDETEGLFVDPYLKMRPAWRYCAGAREGSLHGVVWQLSLYSAIAQLRLGRNLGMAEEIIERVLGLQERDASNPDYGNFRHILELEQVSDRNTIFFVNFALLVALNEYSDKLSLALRQRIEESLAPSLQNLLAGDKEANFSYTNANLGRIACGLLIAEYLGNSAAKQRLLAEFFQSARANATWGIAERLSDTYYMVDILALGLIMAYSSENEAASTARSLFQVFVQELKFFADRQPLPARRTYNQEMGMAGKVTVLDWLLGDLPVPAEKVPAAIGCRAPSEPLDETFRTHGGWAAIIDPVLRQIASSLPPAPEPVPRIMTGKLVGDSFYVSFFHEHYTLGSISDYPTLNLRHQHVSDMPVGFSGKHGDLGFAGMYAVDDEGITHSHPGRFAEVRKEGGAHHGMPGVGRPAVIRSAAVQSSNVCVVLYDLDGLSANIQELGILLRVPQFRGSLLDEAGNRQAPGGGRLSGPWCFLEAPGFSVGIRALSHYNPQTGCIEEGTFRYEFIEGHFQLFLPILHLKQPMQVECDSISAGLVIACHSTADRRIEEFIESTRQWKVSECWDDDRYTFRCGLHDAIRRIRLETSQASLGLDYDCRLHRTTARTINGRSVPHPDKLFSIVAADGELL